jgi:hypothetical protein
MPAGTGFAVAGQHVLSGIVVGLSGFINHVGIRILSPQPGRRIFHGHAKIYSKAVLPGIRNNLQNIREIDFPFPPLVISPYLLDLDHVEAELLQDRKIMTELLERKMRLAIDVCPIWKNRLSISI